MYEFPAILPSVTRTCFFGPAGAKAAAGAISEFGAGAVRPVAVPAHAAQLPEHANLQGPVRGQMLLGPSVPHWNVQGRLQEVRHTHILFVRTFCRA
jgi:hypothetical protein